MESASYSVKQYSLVIKLILFLDVDPLDAAFAALVSFSFLTYMKPFSYSLQACFLASFLLTLPCSLK